MKNNPGKKTAFSMVLALLLTSLFWFSIDKSAYGASPSFVESKVEIIGEDQTYQLEIKDKVAGSKYKWSSSNSKVARVSSKGIVTSVGKGTATIKCKITYPTNKSKTIKCKVIVIIPATKIRINNATEENGAHILKLGETYNFNRDITPSNSSDKTYWSIGGGDPECIRVVNSSNGIVEGTKAGKVVLVATAARKATKAEAKKSIVNDAIIIEVVKPSATVNSASIISNNEIKVVFDSPIDEKTVIGQNNILLDSIDITLKRNIKGVLAGDPGKLTAKLSDDKKTLIITSSNRLEGEYGINFTSKIKTVDGEAIEEYYKQIRYEDTILPEIADIILDDSGMIVTIVFSEAIDFSGLKVSNAAIVPGSSSSPADPLTISILNNKNNYIPSQDKKSLTINLSNIAYSDYDKVFTVVLSGIKDLAGNAPANYNLPVYLRTDTRPKPQARLISIARTSYNTLTAIFDRSIQYGGYATINNGSTMVGIVDSQNPKKVHYTLSEADALKTGIQTVSLTGWQAYNVDPSDTTSYKQHTRTISFNVDKSNPVLLSQEFDPETNILTLTYNKEVVLWSDSGVFNASLVTVTDEIRSNYNLTYSKLATDDPKVIKLQIGNMTLIGNYTFTLSKNFVMDTFRNYSTERTITISNSDGVDLELPGPYMISQSTTNPSQIYLDFNDMLDIESAQNVTNYGIPGVTIISAKLEKNSKYEGARVVLTLADESIDISMERPIKISGVKGYNGIYGPIIDYTSNVYLRDNKKPYYVGPPVFDKNKPNEIRLRFSEEITGSMVVKVTQLGTYSYVIGNSVSVSGSEVIITLNTIPDRNAYLRIEIIDNKILDLSGNQSSPMSTQVGVVAQY